MKRSVFTLADFLTKQQIKAVVEIWRTDNSNFHRRVLEEIVRPAMPDINRKLGQKNVPQFIAYAIEYVMIRQEGRHG
jgi:hypothetical protein